MDSPVLYRPTLEEQRFFDDVRRHIKQHRDDFREAGQWLESEYAIEQVDRREREGRPGDPANYQQAHKEMEQRYRAAGVRTKERSKASVSHARLSHCARDILHDQPDVTNYERNERLPLARRIIFVTWLMTDPDAAELKLGFTTLELMPWGGDWGVYLLGRSTVRDNILRKGWMELAHPAWLVLCPEEKIQLGADEKSDDITRRASPALSLRQFGKALIMDYRAFKLRADSKWGLQSDPDLTDRWTIDYNLLDDPGKERQIEKHAADLRALLARRSDERAADRDKPKKT